MTALALVAGATAPTELEALLLELARYGQPRVGVYGSGWHCTVEMNTNTTGATFNFASDLKLPTPMAATKQCHDRVIVALKALGAK